MTQLLKQEVGGLRIEDVVGGNAARKASLAGEVEALVLSFGVGTQGDQKGDTRYPQRPLELRAGILSVSRGLIIEMGQFIGLGIDRATVIGEGAAEVFEMMPGDGSRDERGSKVSTGVVVDGE